MASLKATLAAAALSTVAVIGYTAAPAQAHNPNYHCHTYWQGNGAGVNCSGGGPGDQARLRLVCERAGGGVFTTLFSGWITNGLRDVNCPANWDSFTKSGQGIYADGHGFSF